MSVTSTGLKRHLSDVGAIESSYQKPWGVSKGLPRGQGVDTENAWTCCDLNTSSTLTMIQMLSKSQKGPLTSICCWLSDGFLSIGMNPWQYKCWTFIRPMHTVHQTYIPPTNIEGSHPYPNSLLLYNFKVLAPREVLAYTEYHALLVFH